ARNRRGPHLERGDADRLGRGDALGEAVEPPVVHQEADRAAVHPEHRQMGAFAFEHPMQRVEHEAVAAERNERLSVLCGGERIAPPQERRSGFGDFAVGGEQADAAAGEIDRLGWLWRVRAQSSILMQFRLASNIKALGCRVTVPFRVVASAKALFARAAAAGLDERLSRLVKRKALRSAATWEGPLKGLKLSVNLLPEDISRDGYEKWLLDEAAAAGMDPKRLTVEIT